MDLEIIVKKADLSEWFPTTMAISGKYEVFSNGTTVKSGDATTTFPFVLELKKNDTIMFEEFKTGGYVEGALQNCTYKCAKFYRGKVNPKNHLLTIAGKDIAIIKKIRDLYR